MIFHPYTGSGSTLDVTPWPGRYLSGLLLHPNYQDVFVRESTAATEGEGGGTGEPDPSPSPVGNPPGDR